MREALRGLWQGYEGVPAPLERVLGCAAARLVQMALEVMHGREEPPPMSLSLLEMGAEVAADPGGAGRWLGLEG